MCDAILCVLQTFELFPQYSGSMTIFCNSLIPYLPQSDWRMIDKILYYEANVLFYVEAVSGQSPVSVAHLEHGGHLEHQSSSTSGAAPQIGAQASTVK